jgi:hypothetical protein
MSISITFNGETPDDIQREIADWHNLLIAGACAISNDRSAEAVAAARSAEAVAAARSAVAAARAAEVRVAQEKAQRAETYAANVADLKEIAAAMPVVDVAPEQVETATVPLEVATAEADATAPVSDPGATSAEPSDVVPEYAVVREAVLRLAVTKSSDITRALLDRYGAAKASDLDPSRWNELLADVNATLKE